ncbi:P-selectin-like [Oscarella lobularis]|uniref:P-selectin-like n=1 Tax=Oscarella lobularis TaxID=121494 RepID=UPI0033133CF7
MQPDFGTLSLPSTVSVFGSHLTLLAIAHFECATGFVLSGEAELTCWRNGTWSDFSPQCLGRCPVLDDPLFGSKSTSNRLSGTVVQFDCDENYFISGPGNTTCRANGTWSADEPTCEELRCPSLAIENGRSSTNETERGTIVEIVCDEGHSLELGPRQFSCLSNGSWSATIPICSIVHCPALGAPVNGAKESNETVFQSVVEFECNFGYYIQGASNVTCLASGGWSAAEPICQPFRCDQLDVLLNGRNSTSEKIFGTRVEFNCDVGFKLNGLREIVCFPNGSWSGIVPWCKAIHCGNLTVPSNGFLSSEKTIFNISVKFDCENGYVHADRRKSPYVSSEWHLVELGTIVQNCILS